MISLGTGLFKTFYDPVRHNSLRSIEHKIKEKVNIIEDKIKSHETFWRINDYNDCFSFNLTESIR